MMVSDQDFKSYLKLAKIHAAMSGNTMNMDTTLKLMTRILDQEGDINYKVPNRGLYKLPSSDLAGCTVLHLSYRKSYGKYSVFNLLLDRGADVTSTNSEGHTIVHEVIHDILRDDCWVPQNARSNKYPCVKASLSAQIRFQNTTNPVDGNGLSHFHAACMTNNVEAIEFFLNNGVSAQQSVNADSPIFAGYTPLHFATKFVCLDAVKLLLQRGADVLARDAGKMTPLHVIISNISKHGEKDAFSLEEYIDVIEEITKEDKNVDAQDHLGLSYLHVLCTFKNTSRLERHLCAVKNVNCAVNADSPVCPGFTPLHFAALCNLDSLKLLVAKGGDITIKDAEQDTPLDLCFSRYDIEDIHDILDRSTCKDVTLSNGTTKLTDLIFSMRSSSLVNFSTLLRKQGDVNANIPLHSPLWPGYTLLHLTVIFHKRCSNDKKNKKTMFYELIENCLKNGADVSAKGVCDQTPLQYAFGLGCAEAVNLMLKYHEGTSNPVDKDGLSHLHIACAAGNKDVVQALLANGADVNCKLGATFTWYLGYHCDQRVFFCGGSTPLHVIVTTRNHEMAKLLLESGADVQAQDAHGLTAVHRVITSNYNREVCNELLSSKNLQECVVDGCGLSHLHVACVKGHSAAVTSLVYEYGAWVDRIVDCNTTSERRDAACQHGRKFGDRYGDPSVEPLFALMPFDGFTPLHFAIRHMHNFQTVKLLLQHGADMLAQSFAGSVPLYSAMSGDRDCYGYRYWRNFVATLKRDEDLRRRVEQVSGSTDLHLACYGRELSWIRKLLSEGADVNARIRDDSPFWPGHTPLHVLMRNTVSGRDDKDTIFHLLLSHGADVAISNGQFTPLQLVRSSKGLLYETLEMNYKSSRAISMLRSIRDFSRNPTTHLGTNHFHIACNYHEVDVVEEFLKHGVDVNAKIDYFSKYHAGCTPLHVTLFLRGDSTAKMRIVELLLKNGADLCAEDVFGDTPLHYAAETGAEQIFRIIIDAGADIDAKNVNGASPVKILLKKWSVEIETIKHVIKHGYCITGFDSVTHEGIIPIIHQKLRCTKNDVKTLILSSPNIIKLDEKNRSAIHNIVSVSSSNSWQLDYTDFIEEFEKLGCDVDHQDKSGRTALHTAVQFRNNKAITALLAVGADINIIDGEGKTAYANAMDLHLVHKQNYRGCSIDDAIDLFTTHVHKLRLAGIHISALNERSKEIVLEKNAHYKRMMDKQRFCTFSDSMEKVKIGSRSLTLYGVISETADLRKYSKMTRADRDAVVEYFESVLNAKDYRKFDKFRCLVKLQHRHLLSRSKLIEAAKLALDTLANIPVPDPCSRAILAHFENWELRNVIEAAN